MTTKNDKNKKRKLIPIKIKNPKVHRQYDGSGDVPDNIELDFDKLEAEVIFKQLYIRGIIKIPLKNGEKTNFLKMDKIWSFSDNGEFIERYRNDNELTGDIIYGRFEYDKLEDGIVKFMFNKNLGLPKNIREKLNKICSDLIYDKLDRKK